MPASMPRRREEGKGVRSAGPATLPSGKMSAMRLPRFQFQFGLKTLFVLVTLAAVAACSGHYAILRKQVRDAEYHYHRTESSVDWGAATVDDALDASEKWLQAELRVPFADRLRAKSDHAERIEIWEIKVGGVLETGLFAGGSESEGWKETEREYERLRELHEKAQEQVRQEQGR
jgi:hypothetical protein